MKCPHCNGEHPDEFAFCPNTGKKIELKACTNESCSEYGKHVLPMEAKFCPKCGQRIDSSDDKTTTHNEQNKVVDDEWLMSKLFPIAGITLGKTSVEDIRNKSYLYKELEFNKDGDVVVTSFEGAHIWQWRWDNAFASVFITRWEKLFDKWKNLGFSWQLSYDDWKTLFDKLDFEIEVTEKPHVEVDSGRKTLNAKFVATSPGRTLEFTLEFLGGNMKNEGHSQSSKNSLYEIRLDSKKNKKYELARNWTSGSEIKQWYFGTDGTNQFNGKKG